MGVVKVDKAKAKLKDWIRRVLYSDDEDKTMSGLPFDSAMMEQVTMEIRNKRMGDWNALTPDEKDKRMQSIVDETWSTMYEKVVKFTQPDRTKEDFDQLMKVYFSTLDPTDQWFGLRHQLSKILSLQAYWNGGEKNVYAIDEQAKKLVEMYNTMPADVTELWKETMKVQKDLTLSGEISLFIKALEPFFVMKILNQVRTEHASSHFVRASHLVMKTVHDHDFKNQMAYYDKAMTNYEDLETEKANLRAEMFEFQHLV